MPKVIMLVGPPGVGKTLYARAKYPYSIHIDPRVFYDAAQEKEYLDSTVVGNRDIVIDWRNGTREARDFYISYYKNKGKYRIECQVLNKKNAFSSKENAGTQKDNRELSLYESAFEFPSVEEGFAEVQKIDLDEYEFHSYQEKAVFFHLYPTTHGFTDKDKPDPIVGIERVLNLYRSYGYFLIGFTNLIHNNLQEMDMIRYAKKVIEVYDTSIDDILICPHNNDNCECRFPKPSLIYTAQAKFKINLHNSFLIGSDKKHHDIARVSGIKNFFYIDDFMKLNHSEHKSYMVKNNLLPLR